MTAIYISLDSKSLTLLSAMTHCRSMLSASMQGTVVYVSYEDLATNHIIEFKNVDINGLMVTTIESTVHRQAPRQSSYIEDTEKNPKGVDNGKI